MHCVWECDKMKAFWREAINQITLILSANIPLDAEMILLHLYPTNLKLKPQEYKFIDFTILQAKRTIALKCKKNGCIYNWCLDQE